MQCATHPERNSIGYCKKCGSFGCAECIVKVEVRGDLGTQSRATEVLVCRDCLSRIRPDLIPPETGGKHTSKKKPAARRGKAGKRPTKALAACFAIVLVAFAVWVAARFVPRINVSHQLMSPEEVAADGLAALSAGNPAQFLSCVDVCEFMCRMDSTGMTRRDYEGADRKYKSDLLESHGELLTRDLFVVGNLRKKFEVTGRDVKENSASVAIKPWIQCGNRLYKRIVLEKKMGEWKICGLDSPDY
jgi:hypothetical protein